MKGGGYYSLATRGAKDVIDTATPLVLRAIERMAPGGDVGVFTITDMGCADGGTSIGMVRAALERVRALAPSRPIQMVYTDQTRNDYNALFQIIHGATEIKSYLTAIEDVFVFASATSFYLPILPRGTLNLGFSATAMHWLSAKPGNVSNHVHAVGAQGVELAAFVEQGRRDWETILLHRAAELAPGGRLVLVNFCRDEQDRYLGNTGGVHMFDTFNAIWQSFVTDGIISEDEYLNMTLPQYYRSVEEFTAPLAEPASTIYKAGLRLEEIETRIVQCPFAAEFHRHADAVKFARSYIPTLRSWTESTFFGALSSERPLEKRREIIDRYYSSYETMVRDDPEGHGMDYVHAYMSVVKV
ncbi:MAG: SAM-dependent methyltransferase [Acidiferrobacterales bacterium]